MKHHGCYCDFNLQRNKELLRTYRRVLATQSYVELRKVCEIVANSPCSRFWVSEERAAAVVSAILKGQYCLDTMKPTKRDMFLEIYRRVVALRQEQPELSVSDACFICVNSPAPRFYMTPKSVLQIVWRIRKGHYKIHNGC